MSIAVLPWAFKTTRCDPASISPVKKEQGEEEVERQAEDLGAHERRKSTYLEGKPRIARQHVARPSLVHYR